MYLGPYEIRFIFSKFILLNSHLTNTFMSSPEVDGVVPPNQYDSFFDRLEIIVR